MKRLVLAAFILGFVSPAASGQTPRDTEHSLDEGTRPAGYYSLANNYPDDAKLCRQFLGVMNEAFRTSARPALAGAEPNHVGDLFIGSRASLEPWEKRRLKDERRRSGAFMDAGFLRADINHDGEPDRIYRFPWTRSAQPPVWLVSYYSLHYRLGRPGETRSPEADVFDVLTGRNPSTEFVDLTHADFDDVWHGERSFRMRSHSGMPNYSAIDIDGQAYLLAANAVYPMLRPMQVSLVNFADSRPYVACTLASEFVDRRPRGTPFDR